VRTSTLTQAAEIGYRPDQKIVVSDCYLQQRPEHFLTALPVKPFKNLTQYVDRRDIKNLTLG
jgi:hypothetical protein